MGVRAHGDPKIKKWSNYIFYIFPRKMGVPAHGTSLSGGPRFLTCCRPQMKNERGGNSGQKSRSIAKPFHSILSIKFARVSTPGGSNRVSPVQDVMSYLKFLFEIIYFHNTQKLYGSWDKGELVSECYSATNRSAHNFWPALSN